MPFLTKRRKSTFDGGAQKFTQPIFQTTFYSREQSNAVPMAYGLTNAIPTILLYVWTQVWVNNACRLNHYNRCTKHYFTETLQ